MTIIEAESFTWLGGSGFIAQNAATASGGRLIRLVDGSSGTVSTDLAAAGVADGVYTVRLTYYDESDGDSTARLLVDGSEIGNWVFSDDATSGAGTQAKNLRTVEFTGVAIGPKSMLTLDATSNATESVRVDFAELVRTGDLPADYEPPAAPIRIEAEAFTGLSNSSFFVQSAATASGAQLIRLRDGSSGTVSTDLAAASVGDGVYTVKLTYYDENDGDSPVRLLVDGVEVGNWVLNNDTGSGNAAQSQNLRTMSFSGVTIGPNSRLTLEATSNATESVRVDFAELVRMGDLPADYEPPAAPIRIEAEAFTGLSSSSFFAQNATTASGGQLIRLRDGSSGTVSTDLAAGGVGEGVYTVKLTYYDESDGASPVRLLVDDVQVGSWVLDNHAGSGAGAQAQNLRTMSFSGIAVGANSRLMLEATSNATESVRVDFAELVRTGDLPADHQPASAPVRIEAEAFTGLSSSSFFAQNAATASGGRLIRLTDGSSGTVSTNLAAAGVANGVYTVKLTYFDENDGASPVRLLLTASRSAAGCSTITRARAMPPRRRTCAR
jgi:hypothetical protein